jgi:hypothetical protein
MERPKKPPIKIGNGVIVIGALVGGAFLVLGLLLLGVVALVIWLTLPDRQGPFKSRMGEYVAHREPTVKPENSHPLPKWVVVDMGSKQVDDLHFKLPPELRATGPNEVRTVVRLNRGRQTLGTQVVTRSENRVRYHPTGSTTREFCDVAVIDHATGAVLANTTIGGSNGEKPSDAQILEYLLSLLPH